MTKLKNNVFKVKKAGVYTIRGTWGVFDER